MPGYYDHVLVLIPLALAGGTALSTVPGVPLAGAVSVASLVGMACVAHALFVRGPTDPLPARTAPATDTDTNAPSAPGSSQANSSPAPTTD